MSFWHCVLLHCIIAVGHSQDLGNDPCSTEKITIAKQLNDDDAEEIILEHSTGRFFVWLQTIDESVTQVLCRQVNAMDSERQELLGIEETRKQGRVLLNASCHGDEACLARCIHHTWLFDPASDIHSFPASCRYHDNENRGESTNDRFTNAGNHTNKAADHDNKEAHLGLNATYGLSGGKRLTGEFQMTKPDSPAIPYNPDESAREGDRSNGGGVEGKNYHVEKEEGGQPLHLFGAGVSKAEIIDKVGDGEDAETGPVVPIPKVTQVWRKTEDVQVLDDGIKLLDTGVVADGPGEAASDASHNNELPRLPDHSEQHETIEVTNVGSITSPYYPEPYSNGVNVSWSLHSPENLPILLQVVDFHTEEGIDELSIYNEIDGNRSLYITLSGSFQGNTLRNRVRRDTETVPWNDIIAPNASRLYLEFISDSHKSFKGFNLTYDVEIPAPKSERSTLITALNWTNGYVVTIGIIIGVIALVVITVVLLYHAKSKQRERLRRDPRIHPFPSPSPESSNQGDNRQLVYTVPNDVEMQNFLNHLRRPPRTAQGERIEDCVSSSWPSRKSAWMAYTTQSEAHGQRLNERQQEEIIRHISKCKRPNQREDQRNDFPGEQCAHDGHSGSSGRRSANSRNKCRSSISSSESWQQGKDGDRMQPGWQHSRRTSRGDRGSSSEEFVHADTGEVVELERHRWTPFGRLKVSSDKTELVLKGVKGGTDHRGSKDFSGSAPLGNSDAVSSTSSAYTDDTTSTPVQQICISPEDNDIDDDLYQSPVRQTRRQKERTFSEINSGTEYVQRFTNEEFEIRSHTDQSSTRSNHSVRNEDKVTTVARQTIHKRRSTGEKPEGEIKVKSSNKVGRYENQDKQPSPAINLTEFTEHDERDAAGKNTPETRQTSPACHINYDVINVGSETLRNPDNPRDGECNTKVDFKTACQEDLPIVLTDRVEKRSISVNDNHVSPKKHGAKNTSDGCTNASQEEININETMIDIEDSITNRQSFAADNAFTDFIHPGEKAPILCENSPRKPETQSSDNTLLREIISFPPVNPGTDNLKSNHQQSKSYPLLDNVKLMDSCYETSFIIASKEPTYVKDSNSESLQFSLKSSSNSSIASGETTNNVTNDFDLPNLELSPEETTDNPYITNDPFSLPKLRQSTVSVACSPISFTPEPCLSRTNMACSPIVAIYNTKIPNIECDQIETASNEIKIKKSPNDRMDAGSSSPSLVLITDSDVMSTPSPGLHDLLVVRAADHPSEADTYSHTSPSSGTFSYHSKTESRGSSSLEEIEDTDGATTQYSFPYTVSDLESPDSLCRSSESDDETETCSLAGETTSSDDDYDLYSSDFDSDEKDCEKDIEEIDLEAHEKVAERQARVSPDQAGFVDTGFRDDKPIRREISQLNTGLRVEKSGEPVNKKKRKLFKSRFHPSPKRESEKDGEKKHSRAPRYSGKHFTMSTELAGTIAGVSLPNPEPPAEFICPITGCVMSDPVIATDKKRYEKEAIVDWFLEHTTWPGTEIQVTDTRLQTDYILATRIRNWKSQKHQKRMRVRREIRKTAASFLSAVDV